MTDHPGEPLVQQLVWVHSMLRRDLATVRDLAARAAAGAGAAEVRAALDTLRIDGPLFQLRVNCLQYCQLVHHHHSLESAMLFPVLRRVNPALGPAVDRLEADHRKVGELLDTVTAEADALAGDDPQVRQRLVDALGELADHLLEHLAFEEESISPTLRTMTGWY